MTSPSVSSSPAARGRGNRRQGAGAATRRTRHAGGQQRPRMVLSAGRHGAARRRRRHLRGPRSCRHVHRRARRREQHGAARPGERRASATTRSMTPLSVPATSTTGNRARVAPAPGRSGPVGAVSTTPRSVHGPRRRGSRTERPSPVSRPPRRHRRTPAATPAPHGRWSPSSRRRSRSGHRRDRGDAVRIRPESAQPVANRDRRNSDGAASAAAANAFVTLCGADGRRRDGGELGGGPLPLHNEGPVGKHTVDDAEHATWGMPEVTPIARAPSVTRGPASRSVSGSATL